MEINHNGRRWHIEVEHQLVAVCITPVISEYEIAVPDAMPV